MVHNYNMLPEVNVSVNCFKNKLDNYIWKSGTDLKDVDLHTKQTIRMYAVDKSALVHFRRAHWKSDKYVW